ncbi:spore coat protein U domain-containing protein [Sphingobium sp.]|uniref:spore coat protein U domain-containing protein n=1 Tax=Sphingobium sp. TaxID=1912891 RepID=UPI003BB761A3
MQRGLLALSLGFALTPMSALAETTKAFQVSADIVQGCIVATNSNGQWGSIDLGTVSGVARGTVTADLLSGGVAGIQIDCTPNMSATISADNGVRGVAGVRALGLNGSSVSTIPYQLFADGSATPWTTQSIALVFGSGATRRVLPIRGVATLSGAMAAGAYSDTVRITLSW